VTGIPIALIATSRRLEMQSDRFDELMVLSQKDLLTEFLYILLRPNDELTDEDRRDIEEIDAVIRHRRIAASA
jgi:hypothetical protein